MTEPTDKQVEAAARAIYRAYAEATSPRYCNLPRGLRKAWEDGAWNLWIDEARAALTAALAIDGERE